MRNLQCSLNRESVQPGSHCMLSLSLSVTHTNTHTHPFAPSSEIHILKPLIWLSEPSNLHLISSIFRPSEEFGGSGRLEFADIGQVTGDCVQLDEICRYESEP